MPKRYPKPQRWLPENREKYEGDVRGIITRSSWERKLLNWCDRTPSVLKYSSEETIIPYISPVDGKVHRYFLDVKMTIKTKTGEIKTYLVEVKPEAQTLPPTVGNKRNKTLLNEVITWEVNKAKWEAAKKYAASKGYEFIILTEKHLL